MTPFMKTFAAAEAQATFDLECDCEECAKYYTPNSVDADGSCPRCGAAIQAPGTMGHNTKSLDLGEVRPALKGRFTVGDIAVQPAFVHMQAEAMKFSPEATQEKTGIHPEVVREEARHFASAKKAVIASGFASAKMLNGIYTQWAQCLICALTGHVGERGGYWSPFGLMGFETAFYLSFLQLEKMPRFESGGLGEFVHGKKIIEARAHYDNAKLKARAGTRPGVTKPAYPAAQIEARNWTPAQISRPRFNAAQRWRA